MESILNDRSRWWIANDAGAANITSFTNKQITIGDTVFHFIAA